MKIALYVPSWPPGSSANGIVTYAAELAPALRMLNHEVFVITANHVSNVVDQYTIDLSKIVPPQTFWTRLKARIFPNEYDAFDFFSMKIVSAILLLKKQYNLDVFEIEESFGWSSRVSQLDLVPVVVRLHGPSFLTGKYDASKPTLQHRRKIEREGTGIGAATLVTAPSATALRETRKYYNLELESARVVANPLDAASNTDTWHKDRCDVNQILFVGRFDRLKGGDLVLHAFRRLAEDYPRLRLTFVGPDVGIQEPGGRKYVFNQFVREHLPSSCWPRIDFLGSIAHSEVMLLRRKHFLTIVASQFEMFPYSVLEAMSVGSPIVATSVGGIPELITHQRNGLLFESQNVMELVSACRKLLDDPSLASSLGAQARKDCVTSFNVQEIASKTISAYRAAIEIYRTRALHSAP